jgi:hypothetical protein
LRKPVRLIRDFAFFGGMPRMSGRSWRSLGERRNHVSDKRNSARSVQILACAHRTPALVGTVFAGLPQELQRAAGRWQAEWETVADLLALTTAAVRHARVLLDELKVDTERMGERL